MCVSFVQTYKCRSILLFSTLFSSSFFIFSLFIAAICVELYKLLLDKPIEQLRNTFSNLALPLFTSAEPDPPKHTTALVNGKEWKWTQVIKEPLMCVCFFVFFVTLSTEA